MLWALLFSERTYPFQLLATMVGDWLGRGRYYYLLLTHYLAVFFSVGRFNPFRVLAGMVGDWLDRGRYY